MIKLNIYNIQGYNYMLKDSNNKEYNINIEFYDIQKSNINDIIYINEELLNEINNQVVSFGLINDSCGKKIVDSNDKDIIFLKNNEETICLKRIYG